MTEEHVDFSKPDDADFVTIQIKKTDAWLIAQPAWQISQLRRVGLACRAALEAKPKKSPLRPEPPRSDPGQDVTKAAPKPVSESEDTVTIKITREAAEEILASEYGCSECNGIAEPLIAAVRSTLKRKREEINYE